MKAMQFQNLWLVVVTMLLNHLPTAYVTNVSAMKLEFVQVIFRHGERTPRIMEYNVLNYTDMSTYEPFGLEHLTNNKVLERSALLHADVGGYLEKNTGKMQAYKVGKMLKKRYKSFLNESYSSQDVYARSSEDERTRMTLQLVLAALFPPTKELQWHPTLNWTPIVYRYVPEELDSLLKTQHTAKFKKFNDDVWQKPWGLEKLAQYKDIFYLLEKHDIKVSQRQMTDLGSIHNILHIRELLKLPLPKWYTEAIKLRFKKSLVLCYDAQSHTQQLKKLNGGPIIKTFIKNINLDQSTANPMKLYLYSGHDLNIASVIRALNITGFEYSDFCTSLILETWRDSKNQVYVRLLHWDAIKEKLSTTRMGNCEELCPINNFLEITRDLIPSDEELFFMYDQFDIDCVKRFFP